MSMYSGKCDFGDWLFMINDDKPLEEVLANTKVYIGDNILPLKMETYKDALPYAPFLTTTLAHSDGKTVIRLSTRSYVDIEEEEFLMYEMDAVKRRYRSLKRKKEKITEDELLKSIVWGTPKEYQKEIVKNVLIDKEKASIQHIHIDLKDKLYRERLVKDMVSAGWTYNEAYQWVYGWYRFVHEVLN